MGSTEKYGVRFPEEFDDAQIERYMIQKGGRWEHKGKTVGNGLSFHYEAFRKLLWPELDDHRWHRICRDTILENKTTVLLGCASSGKTHEASWIFLCEYFCFPDETCVLVSSTDMRGLRLRVWGEITMLWERAVQRYEWLPGNLLDSRVAITTDRLEDGDFENRSVRDMRKGIVGIPTVQGGKQVGLQKWIGLKQKRVRLIADEGQSMGSSFLSAFANLNKNESFRAIVLGNPNETTDPLGRAAEPLDGWSAHLEPTKTCVWKTRFMNGACVNLVGTDSPNFDYPESDPTRYKYLISREKIAETLSFFPKESVEYYSQCVGIMKVGMLERRVLTRDICRLGRALEKAVWRGGSITKVYFVDASYGGDRCVAGMGEFGPDVEGHIVLSFGEPKIIPILANQSPEYQIAAFVRQDCEFLGVPPENMGHDATGRGSLGTSLGAVWSNLCNPIESGGAPTDRPVSLDLFIQDPKTGGRRHKLCSEHYDRLVTEYWYSVRYAVEAKQIRNLNEEVMDELCTRKWDYVKGTRISVEPKDAPVSPTKPTGGMKQRTGKSPDLGDWAAGIVEMARRRGFQIARLSNEQRTAQDLRWLDNLRQKARDMRKGATLNHAA